MPAPHTPSGDALQPLLDQLTHQLAQALAHELAPLLATELASRTTSPTPTLPTRRLLTLDELVAHLPAGKPPTTWKRWLYERTRHRTVPGLHKLGGRLFFDPEHTIPWLTGASDGGVDVAGKQSLHQPPMNTTSSPGAGR